MSATADLELCVLFDHELRLAAKLMREAFDHAHSTEEEIADRSEIYSRAIVAAHNALASIKDDRHIVIIDVKQFLSDGK